MLHTPIPDRIASNQGEQRLPPATGILIALGGSVMLWTAIVIGCVLAI